MTVPVLETMNKEAIRALVVGDDPDFREMVTRLLTRKGFAVSAADENGSATELSQQRDIDVIVIDPKPAGASGIDGIERLHDLAPDVQVVVMSASAAVQSSALAAGDEIFCCLSKPADPTVLEQTIRYAAERRRLLVANRMLADQLRSEHNLLQKHVSATKKVLERRVSASPMLIGESDAIVQIRQFIAEVAPADISVLIRGESGTGKDIVSRLIHEWSGRSINTFVKINCPAIPETLLESELFGHEPGAFTGGERRKPGRFEQAAGGTIFLDEIGEIPPSIQVKLLQAIEHKEFRRLGGNEAIHIDTRIIGATNAPLETMLATGRFRTDLFYRLNEYAIELPPLRQRVEDIPLLIDHFLQKYAVKSSPRLAVSPDTMSSLMRYQWPGNVRELESIIKRFVLTGREEVVLNGLGRTVGMAGDVLPKGGNGNSRLRHNEIQTIIAALTEARWNQRRAAEILGVSYSALRRRIAKYDLKNYSESQLRGE